MSINVYLFILHIHRDKDRVKEFLNIIVKHLPATTILWEINEILRTGRFSNIYQSVQYFNCACVCTCIKKLIFVCVPFPAHVCFCDHVYVHANDYIHKYIHIHVYICLYLHLYVSLSVFVLFCLCVLVPTSLLPQQQYLWRPMKLPARYHLAANKELHLCTLPLSHSARSLHDGRILFQSL